MGSSLGLMNLPIPGTTSNKPSNLTRPLSSSTRPKTKRKSAGSGHNALKTTCALKYEETLRKDSI